MLSRKYRALKSLKTKLNGCFAFFICLSRYFFFRNLAPDTNSIPGLKTKFLPCFDIYRTEFYFTHYIALHPIKKFNY